MSTNEAVWKFPIRIDDTVTVRMPAGAEVLTAQLQGGELCLWARVDTDNLTVNRMFYIRGTGHPFTGAEGRYVSTFQLQGGALIFHVFEAKL